MTTSRLEIDLGAVDRNVAILRSMTEGAGPGKVRLCAVIKQDAYAMGAGRMAKRLESAGVDLLAVYSLDEARALADLPIETPILVLMPVHHMERADALYRLASRSRLHLVVHNPTQAADLAALATRMGVTLPCHVQLDTGLSRGGCLGDQAERTAETIVNGSRLRLAGAMTHFSSPAADSEFTDEQARRFRLWIERVKPLLVRAAERGHGPCAVHAANTAALLRSASLHGTMVRIGQGLYGYGLEDMASPGVQFARQASGLEPAVRWVSRIVHVQDVPAGWPVGYGKTFVTRRPSRIALVPVGYAAGLPISLGNVGTVGLTGRPWLRVPVSDASGAEADVVFAPIVGRVSMDQITVDVTDLPERFGAVNAEVELVGRTRGAPNHLPTLARTAGTITHDLLSRIGAGVERHYLASTTAHGRTAGEPGRDHPCVDAAAAAAAAAERARRAVSAA
ncbi:MAG: alanine racemase [Phycisphaerae bacterium]|nr:alanine racemase [Phycisphaerae bacterium]